MSVAGPDDAAAGRDDETPFEILLGELDDVLARLERGDVPLDEAIALWRRGEALYVACRTRLDSVEGQIEQIREGDG